MKGKMTKRLEKLLLIPLVVILTACPKEFELDNLETEKIQKIECNIKASYSREEGKKWDVIFEAWYDLSKEEPDYKHWYRRRNNLREASKDCNEFFKYTRFPR
ncbi:hypothetical protein LCGC14_3066290 [marine sediment metagenome]|uniref:Lipoprotein n=1 Tax=marine sediment metagenome TaxID=412755 RepID=A0A0F8X5N8_9ZZZZ